MSAMVSQITDVAIVWSTVCSGADQRKHQSSASLAFVRGTTGDRWISLLRISNAEKVSISWRRHEFVTEHISRLVISYSHGLCMLSTLLIQWPRYQNVIECSSLVLNADFLIHFVKWGILYFDSKFVEVCFWWPRWQQVSTAWWRHQMETFSA